MKPFLTAISIVLFVIGSFITSFYVSLWALTNKPYHGYNGIDQMFPSFLGYHVIGIAGLVILAIGMAFKLEPNKYLKNRLYAWGVDFVILYLIMRLIHISYFRTTDLGYGLSINNGVETYIKELIGWVFYVWVYYPYMEYNGGTIGKRLFYLKAVAENNEKLSIVDCFKKAFLYGMPALCLISYLSIYPIGENEDVTDTIIWAFIFHNMLLFANLVALYRNGITLSDWFSKTKVVEKPKPTNIYEPEEYEPTEQPTVIKEKTLSS